MSVIHAVHRDEQTSAPQTSSRRGGPPATRAATRAKFEEGELTWCDKAAHVLNLKNKAALKNYVTNVVRKFELNKKEGEDGIDLDASLFSLSVEGVAGHHRGRYTAQIILAVALYFTVLHCHSHLLTNRGMEDSVGSAGTKFCLVRSRIFEAAVISWVSCDCSVHILRQWRAEEIRLHPLPEIDPHPAEMWRDFDVSANVSDASEAAPRKRTRFVVASLLRKLVYAEDCCHASPSPHSVCNAVGEYTDTPRLEPTPQ
jgi:hypothetical protein